MKNEEFVAMWNSIPTNTKVISDSYNGGKEDWHYADTYHFTLDGIMIGIGTPINKLFIHTPGWKIRMEKYYLEEMINNETKT